MQICLALTACTQQDTGEAALVFSGLTMGTTYTVKINKAEKNLSTESLQPALESILADINNKMSTYITDSELSGINQAAAGAWLPLSTDLFAVIEAAMHIAALTDNSFDITVGPLVNLWGFGPDKRTEHAPDKAAIAAALGHTGIRHLQLQTSPPALKKSTEGLYIDLSGIAKGYAVDKLADYLLQQGLHNFMVEIGGEIRANGHNDSGLPWRIGIEQPLPDQRSVQRLLKLENTAMATSGDYRNYFEENGKRYSHTIDPRTGKPIDHRLASVTVLHHSSTYADAFATAFLVMGKDAAFEIAQQQQLAVLFLQRSDDGFTESYTQAMQHHLLEN